MDAAFVLAVVAVLAFAFTNGFNDAANTIASISHVEPAQTAVVRHRQGGLTCGSVTS